MVAVLEQETAPATIEATVNYIFDNGEKIFTQTGRARRRLDVRTGGTQDPRARDHPQRPARSETGSRSTATASASSRTTPRFADFFDEDEIRRVYYPEMEALVKAESGASRVVVFDHTLRTADDELREARKIREVVRRVHNDYTEWSGPQRVRDLLPDEADELLARRFAIVQVWRPIRHPVESHPLAICDARSIVDSRISSISERRYPEPDRPDLRDHLQSGAPLVLVAAHAARRGAGVQGLRFVEGRPRPLDRPHRLRRSDLAAQRPPAREHRDPHAGVFLSATQQRRRKLGRSSPACGVGLGRG